MGAVVLKAMKRPDKDMKIVSDLFDSVVNNEKFFIDLYVMIMSRSRPIQHHLGIKRIEYLTEVERDRINSLATSIRNFLGMVVSLALKGDKQEMEKVTQQVGARHADYSMKHFQPAYWDVFVLALTELMENHESKPSIAHIYKWQGFLRNIVAQMRKGYEIAYAARLSKVRMPSQRHHTILPPIEDINFRIRTTTL